jgi:hypothetical protein
MIYAVAVSIIVFMKGVSKHVYCPVIALILVLISGLRSVNIGIDTGQYYDKFVSYDSTDLASSFADNFTEPGYIVLNYIIYQLFGNQFQVLLLLVALVYVSSVSYVIYRYSEYPWFSYLLFIGFGYFTFGMSGMRQAIAMSFTLLSFVYIQKKNIYKYLLFIGIASSFHISSLIFLPSYFYNKISINKKTLLISALIIILIAIFVDILFGFLNIGARIAYEQTETGGKLMYLFNLLTVLIGLYLKPKEGNNDIYIFMLISAIAMWPIATMNPTMFRLTFYHSIFMIILIPNILKQIEYISFRFIYSISYALVAGYFMLFKVLTSDMQLLPYMFFWE